MITEVGPKGPKERVLRDIDHWTRMYADRAEGDEERYGVLHQILRDFKAFSEEYLAHFEQEVIAPIPPVFDLAETTPDHIRYRALRVIVEEWTVISRAVEQRELQRYETWLTRADSEAKQYLPPGIPGVVSYLGRADAIRQNLYSAASVASIPRHQYKGDDFMATPHEIGHQVFWNLAGLKKLSANHKRLSEGAKDIGESLAGEHGLTTKQGQCLANVMDSWLEESFADVYGTFVAGKDFPDSIINILKQQIGQADELLLNDGDHPIPYLRPLARIRVLELEGNNDAASALRKQWADFIESIGAAGIEDQSIPCFIAPERSEKFTSETQKPIPLPLGVVKEAAYSLTEFLLPIAKQAREQGVYHPAPALSTFDTLKTYAEDQAQEQKAVKAYELLLLPLSTVHEYNAFAAGGPFMGPHGHSLSGHHEAHGYRTHGYSWHTHYRDGSVRF